MNKFEIEKYVGILDEYIERGQLELVPNTDYATTAMLSRFFNVPDKTIKNYFGNRVDYKEQKEILLSDGMTMKSYHQIKSDIGGCDFKVNSRGSWCFPKTAIIRLATILNDSNVALEIRSKMFGVNAIRRERKEVDFLNLIEPTITKMFGYELVRQKTVGLYRLDGYIPQLNLAIEFDENGHKHYNQIGEKQRQSYIEKTLGCRFVRVSDEEESGEAIAKVLIAVTEAINNKLNAVA